MKASELRIGNLVLNKIDNSILEISAKDILFLEEGGDEFIFEPIPLTEEWLLKFWFEKLNSAWYGYGNLKLNISFDADWGGNWLGVRSKHVHKLQNLYFALTGEELTIQS